MRVGWAAGARQGETPGADVKRRRAGEESPGVKLLGSFNHLGGPEARVTAKSWPRSASRLPRLARYALRGKGQESNAAVLYLHDADRIEIVCDRPLPLQVDGEDLGDITSALFEAERSAVLVLD